MHPAFLSLLPLRREVPACGIREKESPILTQFFYSTQKHLFLPAKGKN